jgi:hypothetical protein
MEPPEQIFCPRCQYDQIGRALQDFYSNLGEGNEYRSHLRYRCNNCGCVFLVRDDHLSPGEQAERSMVITRLKEGKTQEIIAKELGMSLKKVSGIVTRYEYDQR